MTISNSSPETEPRSEFRGFDRPRRRSIFFPLLLLTAGALLLLSNLNILGPDMWSNIIRLWPLLFIVGALDGIYRGEGLAGQIFWLGLGVLFLLASLGYLSINIWDLLLRFWPVFLIALGIDILFGNRKEVWARGIAVLLSLALLGGVIWFAGTNFTRPGAQLTSTTINQPVQSATSAEYNISMAAGLMELARGAPAGQLMSGEIRSAPNNSVRESITTEGGRAIYTLKDESVSIHIGNNDDRHWTIKLNDTLPADLDVTMGAGQMDLVLSGMKLERLDATVAVGELNVDLPQQGGYEADMTTVIGQTVIRVPADAAVEIQVDGIFPINVDGQGLTVSGRTVTGTGTGPVTKIKITNIIGSTKIERVR